MIKLQLRKLEDLNTIVNSIAYSAIIKDVTLISQNDSSNFVFYKVLFIHNNLTYTYDIMIIENNVVYKNITERYEYED